MAEYLDSIVTEYYDGSSWVDLTAYVVGDIKGNNGLGGWKPENRVAMLGTLDITLNNKYKYFSPMGGDTLRGLDTVTGFNRGAKIRVRGIYLTFSYTIWTGRILSIDSDDKNWGNEQARVMAVDWMNVPENYPMAGSDISLNKRMDEALSLILARLSIQPEATDFDEGVFTFPAVFDNVQRKTLALSEFTKLANSELGYIYVRQDGTLVAENMLSRWGGRPLDQVWILPETDSFFLLEDGDVLLLEDGDKLILDVGYVDAAIATDAESYNILLGQNSLLNASIIRAFPVVTDTSLKVLYSLGTPLFIPSGQTKTLSAHYTDPSGLLQVSGTNMQTPVATTDYLANTLASGAGTNKTSDVVVTATYYGDTVYYSITNSATVGVYMTRLQARGYGIYYGNSIESTIEDTASQSAHGYAPFQFDMKYQKDTYLADSFGMSIVEEYKTPKSRITKMKYLANLNINHMMSFLVLSIGSLILGTEDRSGISNHYYITDRAFTIKQGGIVHVEYGVKQNDSYLSEGLEPVTVDFEAESTDAINYGNLEQLDNLELYSISVWVKPNATPTSDNEYMIMSFTNGGSGWQLFDEHRFFDVRTIKFRDIASATEWVRDLSHNLVNYTHFVITLNKLTGVLKMYINGTEWTDFGEYPSTGQDGIGGSLVIGNQLSSTSNYENSYGGRIFDPRIYNRILTAEEAKTIYNTGVPNVNLVPEGIIFQGLSTYADNPLAADTVLSSSGRLVENALRSVGIPNGSPVIRANP